VALHWADPLYKESYKLCKNDNKTEEEARAQQRAVEPLMNEWMKMIFVGGILPSQYLLFTIIHNWSGEVLLLVSRPCSIT
jgi:hypothetical protein